MDWSPHQQAVFRHVEETRQSLIVNAVAGSGKTTTIVEAARLLPETERAVFLAFNKSIAETLKDRLPRHLSASTLNSLGYRTLMRYLQQRGVRTELKDTKVRDIVKQVCPVDIDADDLGAIRDVVKLAKVYALRPESTDSWWDHMIQHHSIRASLAPQVIREYAKEALAISNEMLSVVDFADQIYLPVLFRLSGLGYSTIIVDEAQDMSRADRLFIRSQLARDGRVIAVGDPHQAIYGFKGSAHDSMDKIAKLFHAEWLPLSVSYRCPQNVIDLAKVYVPHIEAHESAPAGDVVSLLNYDVNSFTPTDLIVSRKNAPAVAMAFKFIQRGVPAQVMGKDIGLGLIALTKRITRAKKDMAIEDFEDKMSVWRTRQIERAMAKDDEAKADSISDKCATIEAIIEGSGAETLFALRQHIEGLFSPDDARKPCITLSTIHKAKGLEADRVFVLDPGDMPAPWAVQPWEQQQERNLIYVAITRAKRELYFIESAGFRDVREAA